MIFLQEWYWIIAMWLVFLLIVVWVSPKETSTAKYVEREEDKTIEYIAKKPMNVDKRKWDATLSRRR